MSEANSAIEASEDEFAAFGGPMIPNMGGAAAQAMYHGLISLMLETTCDMLTMRDLSCIPGA